MNLSNGERALKLGKSLIRHPHHIWPYLKYNVIGRKMPVELGMPWWSFSAIEAYERVLRPSFRVFEWGSGGSTVFAAQRGASICCVEDSGEWMAVTDRELKKQGLSDVTWRHCLLPPVVEDPAQLEAYVGALDSPEYDAIIIDGHDRPFKNRDLCFRRAEAFSRSGMLVILDDAWRYPHLLESARAREIQLFESTGPGRVGVTSTAFCWY